MLSLAASLVESFFGVRLSRIAGKFSGVQRKRERSPIAGLMLPIGSMSARIGFDIHREETEALAPEGKCLPTA